MGFVTELKMDPYQPPLRPAPIMTVAVQHRDMKGIALLRAFLDTGADRTILAPHSLALLERAIGLIPPSLLYVQHKLRVFYDLSFSFDGGEHWLYPDTPVEYAGSRERCPGNEDMLIGRDLLWQLKFCCNGPKSMFSLKHPQHC